MAEPATTDPANLLPHYVLELTAALQSYLSPAQIRDVERAFVRGEAVHRGQTRQSGEPYITHPVAVARILAEMHLDAETICAAILHDTIEDTGLTKADLEREFGGTVAELVDGVTKLDKFKFENRQAADAESFRKLLMAMARDLRVILIKLADRLHNMRTLGAKASESKRRIARETLEIYAPIAHRLGMNKIKAELQQLGFKALYPLRHAVLEQAAQRLRGDRRETTQRLQAAIAQRLELDGIPHRLVMRVKSPYSIYRKMRDDYKHQPHRFEKVTDVIGLRVVVPSTMHCYMALGSVHSLYKPLDGKFKDYVAIPKHNGYQSLHTVLWGPNGAPIEVQIRSEDMDVVAERGVAAHWVYKNDLSPAGSAQHRAREWLKSLIDSQRDTGNSLEFLDNVKVDLFPDEVYVFTPTGEIKALPKNATAVDFAYAVHTELGEHAVAARIDKQLKPLRTRLMSGQTVEIIRAKSAAPSPQWLEFVVTSKARTAIRHYLKNLQHEKAVELGHRMLNRALDSLGTSLEAISVEVLQAYLAEQKLKRLEELLADVALGNRMPAIVARQLARAEGRAAADKPGEVIRISGAERGVVSFANCCQPIPGDAIVGYLSPGTGLVVHRTTCPNMAEMRKHVDRFVPVAWDQSVEGDYKVSLRVEVANKPGVLATVAAAFAECNVNIDHVEYLERDAESAALMFTVLVRGVDHLTDVLRRVRRADVVQSIQRAIA